MQNRTFLSTLNPYTHLCFLRHRFVAPAVASPAVPIAAVAGFIVEDGTLLVQGSQCPQGKEEEEDQVSLLHRGVVAPWEALIWTFKEKCITLLREELMSCFGGKKIIEVKQRVIQE